MGGSSVNNLIETLVYLFIAFVMLVLAVALNKWSNKIQEAKCADNGGTFYYSSFRGRSLCQLPK